jgi:predicted esterase
MNVWYKYNASIRFCSWTVLFLSGFLHSTLYSQQLKCDQTNENFTDAPIASQVTILTQVYKEAKDYMGEDVRLAADIYRPVLGWTNAQLLQRPLVILLHGGGIKFGSRKTGVQPIMADYLAKRGYVAVCADYRLGWEDFDATLLCGGGTESDYLDAKYRAMQDERSLVQYLKRQANTLGFDTNRIFLAGVSSGATIALSRLETSFIAEQDNRPQRLGALDNFNGNLTQSTSVAGIISIAGANLSADLDDDFNTPVLMMHGTCDNAVPYRESKLAQCPNLGYYYGPGILQTALKEQEVCHQLYTFCGYGHDFAANEEGSGPIPLTLQYILSKSIEFMLDVMCDRCTTADKIVNNEVTFTPKASCSSIDEFSLCGAISPPDQLLVELHPDVIVQDRTIFIKTNMDVARDAEWMIFSATGQLLHIEQVTFPEGISKQSLQFPDLPKGIYFQQLVSGNRRWLSGKVLRM